MIWDFHPGYGSRFFTHPGSWIQRSKRHWIPEIRNTALQFIDKRNYQICTVQVPMCRAVVFTQLNFAF